MSCHFSQSSSYISLRIEKIGNNEERLNAIIMLSTSNLAVT